MLARDARKRTDVRAGASRRHHTVTWIGTAIDTEDQHQLAQSLEHAHREAAENLALLETLHSASPVGFGFVDRDLRVVSLNAALASVNGTAIESQLGRRVADVVPELWSQLEPVFRGVLETGTSVINIELNGPAVGDPATAHHWLASYYPVRSDDEIIGIGIVAVDTTERRQAEALRTTIVDNMAEGLFTLDAEGCLTFLNASGAEILGWTEAELLGSSMHSVVHNQHADGSPNPESECELLKVRSQGRTIRVTGDVFTRKDGTIVPVAYSAAPLVDESTVVGVVVVFRDTSEERAAEERVQRELAALAWVGRIREALDEDRLILYSQPIVPLQGGDASEELLVRMIGRRRGEIILPGSFIPIAERFGMIGEIDRWVITQAIHFAARGHRVEVNLSAQSIHYVLPLIERELRDSGADPANLVVEITETALMQDVHAGEIFAQGLADIGCGLSLDDFGTGFASFTYLKRLPLRSLKIDIEFVRSLTTNPANQHIVKSIVHLARGFGYDTIAEGIEDEDTLALLRKYGVDYGQGHLLGRPAPLVNPGRARS